MAPRRVRLRARLGSRRRGRHRARRTPAVRGRLVRRLVGRGVSAAAFVVAFGAAPVADHADLVAGRAPARPTAFAVETDPTLGYTLIGAGGVLGALGAGALVAGALVAGRQRRHLVTPSGPGRHRAS